MTPLQKRVCLIFIEFRSDESVQMHAQPAPANRVGDGNYESQCAAAGMSEANDDKISSRSSKHNDMLQRSIGIS
jgi:hypothetical protein